MALPELHKFTLSNGLRVVLAPDVSVPAVGVSVHVDVGFRSEPEGRTGFAHLFEHLMFQGSESLEKLAHFRNIQSAGGFFNGSTHPFYTDYYQVVPSAALERALFLEADRLRAPTLSEENLSNQIDVVKEEIRLQVLNKPYGGFPWIYLPPVLFTTFANAHNGYGDFADLEKASVEDCAEFFDTYYAPSNAVLIVAGDFEVSTARQLVEKHFGDIPAREVPPRRSFGEEPPRELKRGEHHDPNAPTPALAIGYRVPDPAADLHGYLSYLVLANVLSDGDSSRLQQRLVHRDALVIDISSSVGFFGPLDSRDPDLFRINAIYPDHVTSEQVIAAIDEEVRRIADSGVTAEELAKVTARWAAALHHNHDELSDRIAGLGSAELLFDSAELFYQLPEKIKSVTAGDVTAAAKALHPDARAILLLTPAQATNGDPE